MAATFSNAFLCTASHAETTPSKPHLTHTISPEMQGLRANLDDAYTGLGVLGSIRMRAGLPFPIWRNNRFGIRARGFVELNDDHFQLDVWSIFPASYWRGSLAVDAFWDMPTKQDRKLRLGASVEHESDHITVLPETCSPVYGANGSPSQSRIVHALCPSEFMVFTNDLSLWSWYALQTGAWRLDATPEVELHFMSMTDRYRSGNSAGWGVQVGLDLVGRYVLSEQVSLLAAVHGKYGFANDHMIEEARLTTRAGIAWSWLGSWSVALISLHGNALGLNRQIQTNWFGFDLRYTPWTESSLSMNSRM